MHHQPIYYALNISKKIRKSFERKKKRVFLPRIASRQIINVTQIIIAILLKRYPQRPKFLMPLWCSLCEAQTTAASFA